MRILRSFNALRRVHPHPSSTGNSERVAAPHRPIKNGAAATAPSRPRHRKGASGVAKRPFLLTEAPIPYCGESTIVKRRPGLYEAKPLKCRSWQCPDCQPGRTRRLIAEGLGGNPTAFLTLTSRRQPGQTPDQAAKALSHAWRKVRLRIMRHYNLKKLPFIAVFEATQLGWPHLHILLRSQWIDQRWLSGQMDELIQSPVVHIKRITGKQQVVGYVAKYCGKAPKQFGSCKRYWKSQDYEQRPDRKNKPPLDPGTSFEVLPYRLMTIVSNWITWGYAVEVEGTGFARARPP